ncbi:MAG: hypothetical protein QNL26_01750 [Acidimicrobiia bacterium]|nr:hypothetical protein [Acidimicrobiia bacterium]
MGRRPGADALVSGEVDDQNTSIEPFQAACGTSSRVNVRGTLEVGERKFLSVELKRLAGKAGLAFQVYLLKGKIRAS